MAKRPCFSDHSPRVSVCDRSNIDTLLESLCAVSDSALITASFDGLVKSRSTDSDQNDFIQRALHLGSVLLEAGKRSVRQRSSVHNASVWPLSLDLTVKVFSMLDTPSLCCAAVTCSFFQKCGKDPLCHANIDLVTLIPKANDAVVSRMVQQAGNALRSIKLGVLLLDSIGEDFESSLLTSSCLSSLSENGGATGSRLRRLHLCNIGMDDIALSTSLSVCPSLIDLEIVHLDVYITQTLESVSTYCRLIERFIYESYEGAQRDDMLEDSACKAFVLNCPKITTLALKDCGLGDFTARRLVKGFHELKSVDFTRSACYTGAFLKNLGTKGGAKNLEVMIIRDTEDLKVSAVKRLIKALLAGEFRLLRHLDISGTDDLAITDCDKHHGCHSLSSLLIKQLLKQRPNFCFVAERSKDSCTFCSSYYTSDSSWDFSDSSDNTSDGSVNSDVGSGSEDSQESNSVDSEESSDEVDDLSD